MKKIAYGISAIFLLLLSFSSISRADGGLDQFVENFSQYRIVHYSPRKWYEYCDITGVHKEGKDEVIIKFKFRGNDTRLTLSKLNEEDASAAGSFPSKGWITSIVDVQLKFNADGTANGKWKDLGFEGSFHILKKGVVLRAALDKLVNNFNRYKIAITPLTGEQVLCDILGIYKEDEDIIIKFQYRGKTRLVVDKFDYDRATVRGKYIREVVGVDIVVPVELIFKADGTAVGTWKRGIGNEFNIVRPGLDSSRVNPVTVISTTIHDIFVPNGFKELAQGAVPQGDYDGILLFGGSDVASSVEEIAAFVVQRPTLGAGSDANSVLQNFRNILSSMGIQLSNVATEKLSDVTMRSNDIILLSTPLTTNALNNLIFEQLGGNIAGAQFTNLPADNPQASQAQEFRCLLTIQYFSDQDIVVTSVVIRESELATYEALVEGIGDGSNVGESGVPRRVGTDQFEGQGFSNKADFLWVVDNSGSMSGEQTAVADAGTEFANRVKNANLDFQVGVITTDSSRLRGKGFTSDIDQFSQKDVVAGIGGSSVETGIWFAEQSLQPVALGDSSKGSVTSSGVPRSGASLSIIILSDEPSQYNSRSGGVAFDDTNNLFIDRGYLVYAIVTPTDAQSSQYDDLALNTGGTPADITNLSSIPKIIEQIVDRAGGMTPFVLTHQPISSTLVVGINGTKVTQKAINGWQYFPNSNTITFFGNVMPQAGDIIQVTYKYY